MAQEERRDYLQYVPAPVKEYNPDHGYLPVEEEVALNTLAHAVRAIARTYVYQINRPFYPNVSIERITEEAKVIKPQLLSPFTLVELDEKGNLVAVPAHVAFREQLKEPISLLKDAHYYTRDPILRKVISATIDALGEGMYEELEQTILSNPMTKIGLRVTLYNRYNDKRLNKKFSYHGAVGTLDEEETAKHQPLVDEIVDTYFKSDLIPSTVIIKRPKVIRIRYNNTEVLGGLPAEIKLTADSSPGLTEWREEYGTEINVEMPPLFDNFRRFRLPLIREIMAVEHRRSQSDSELQEDYGHRFDAHETMHALIRRPSDEGRLGNEYSFINEMSATVIGFATLGRIGLTTKQLEGLIANEFAIAADEYRDFTSGKREREVYLRVGTGFLNYLIRNGGLRINEKGEFYWRDISEIFSSLNTFAHILENLLANGDINDAKILRRILGDLSIFEELRPFRRPGKPPIIPPQNSPQAELNLIQPTLGIIDS